MLPGRLFPSISLKRKDAMKVKNEEELGEVTSLEGPVIKKDGRLMMLIPLSESGEELAGCSQRISEVVDGCLKIVIHDWLAGMLRIVEGDLLWFTTLTASFTSRRAIRGLCIRW